jgi:4-alpha-glucanotransferase
VQRQRPFANFFDNGRLCAYAAEQGVRIVGDIPIFVAGDSADVWRTLSYFYGRREK